ncbi:DUF982 domain-containing protein [Mesorhizobium xinjiangense]|uniref:DUF982 domain-containing protein n=1 Tax=Mesorhizobium xinjiangense TaxID=2678685 RepID=UPI0018DCA9C3|nr:DUF982 domain-containing protein [Mesorhizobium xinjiangense]
MQNRRFHLPVIVQPGRLDRTIVVTDTRSAADILVRRWRWPRTQRYMRAAECCLEVAKGRKPPHLARRAFISAAREARILIDDRPDQSA